MAMQARDTGRSLRGRRGPYLHHLLGRIKLGQDTLVGHQIPVDSVGVGVHGLHQRVERLGVLGLCAIRHKYELFVHSVGTPWEGFRAAPH